MKKDNYWEAYIERAEEESRKMIVKNVHEGRYYIRQLMDFLELDINLFYSKLRLGELVMFRHIHVYFLIKEKYYSLTATGLEVDRNHATIFNSLKNCQQYIQQRDKQFLNYVILYEDITSAYFKNIKLRELISSYKRINQVDYNLLKKEIRTQVLKKLK